MKGNPWWTCNKCGNPVIKVGGKRVHEAMLDHRLTCHELACFQIKQVSQK